MAEEPREGAESSGDVIRGHFVLEPEDVQRGIWEVTVKGRRTLIGILTVSSLLWILPQVMTNTGRHPPWVSLFGIALCVGAVFFGQRRVAARVMSNKTAQERDITWEFDEVGYRVSTPGSEGRGAWGTVHRTMEGEKTFFLYPSSNIYQLIPKRAFRDEDLPRIRELFRTRVTPRPIRNNAWRVLVLWVVFIGAFLAVWQFLESPPSQSTPEQSDQGEAR
jgi:hypothetical protein